MPRESLSEDLGSLRIDAARRDRGRQQRNIPRWVWFVAAGIAVLLIAWGAVTAIRTTPVEAARVVSMEVNEPSAVLVASGYVVAHHKIQLSSKVMGRVAWIGVEKGDVVQKDQVLVRLEADEYKAAADQAQGNLAAAESRLLQLQTGSRPQEIERARAQADDARANLTNATLYWQRSQGLAKDGVISRQDLDRAQAVFDQAKAQLEAAEKQHELVKIGPRREEIETARGLVQQARGQLDYAKTQLVATEIRAPVRGTILDRLVEKGEMVTTSFVGDRGAKSSVVNIADLNDLLVELDISQNDFARVQMKQKCTITADAYPDKRYPGEVFQIAPEANRQKATVQVKVRVLNPDGLLRPEMNAKVNFHNAAGGVVKSTELLVPRSAVFQTDGKSAVMVVEKNRAIVKAVTLGDAAGDSVRITSGLTGAELVVVSQPGNLVNGQRIRVK